MAPDRIFRDRLRDGDLLRGVFLKTPAPHTVELAAVAGCDFVAPDMEHAPIDLGQIDMMIGFAGRAGMAVLPRLPAHDVSLIGRVLDAGADGILVPRVSSRAEAERIVAAARFEGGRRGFSPSPRAGSYGALGAAGYLDASRRRTVVALQIEDRAGLEAVDAIAATPGVDALFIGPADLSMSLDVAPGSDALAGAMRTIAAAARAASMACGLFTPDGADAARWRAAGISWFVIGSDQSHLTSALRAALDASAT